MQIEKKVNASNKIEVEWDKLNAVDRMQKYIISHLDEEITLQKLSEISGYSTWHTLRIFKELLKKTPFEFIRAVKLTNAAQTLRDSNRKVIDVAMDNGFESHDGFTRAFHRQFHITPQKYKVTTPPIAYFTFTPVKHFYPNIVNRSETEMEREKVSKIVTVSVVERPQRKLMLLRSKKAYCYESFCDEVGYEWRGVLNSVPEKFDTCALITLSSKLAMNGNSNIAGGIEVPYDYDKPLPDGYELVELPPCKMMYFQGMPFHNGQDYGEAIGIVFNAASNYNPELYGYRYVNDIAYHFNYGAEAEVGARMAIPVACV